MSTAHQPAILEAMRTPGFYPHPCAHLAVRETHISTIFLTGAFAYKVKKPVDLGFVDFSSLAKRQDCCRAEVRLNRRLSQGVYMAVLPITFQDGGYALDGSGETVEFTVKMRQLRDADTLACRIPQSNVDPAAIDALAQRLADFHRLAAVASGPPASGSAGWEDNLLQLAALSPDIVNKDVLAYIGAAMRTFHERHQPLFERRWQTGCIREGHGDLRCDHIYLTEDGIQIIDGIEFNPSLRVIDTISDLAFLIMDLTARRAVGCARRLLDGYIRRCLDLEALPLLDFYCCYRALVRCKVAGLQCRGKTEAEPETTVQRNAAAQYLALAGRFANALSRPRLWIMCGLPASGKSTIAAALGDTYRIPVIQSDRIRRQLFPNGREDSTTMPFEGGRYTAHATESTYRRILSIAEEALQSGRSAILDATFSRVAWRQRALELADKRNALAILVECRVDDAGLVQRLKQRDRQPSLSEARLNHLGGFKKRFEPLQPMRGVIHIRLDTSRTATDCLMDLLLDKQNLINGIAPGGDSCFNTSSPQPI